MSRVGLWATCAVIPVAGFVVLLGAPRLDLHWEDNAAHFWLVVAAGGVSVALGLLAGETARRRADARVFLVSLAFLAAAGFLTLHALATPGVLLDGPNAGFVIAAPVGLLLAAALAAASSLELGHAASSALLGRYLLANGAVAAILAAWAAVSLAGLPPLEHPLTPAEERGPLVGVALAGFVLFGVAAARYLQLYRRRPSFLLLAIVTSFALLAEAMFAVAISRAWHATWWEWHLLMLAAFAFVAYAVRRERRREGAALELFADAYLEETRAGKREVTVLFADLQGFTSFAERAGPEEVFRMLNTYFGVTVPLIAGEHGGTIDKLMGDAIMVTFNTRGDQPDHALRAARAGLGLQQAAGKLAAEQPGWPRFRVGVNTGEAVGGIVGGEGGRSYTVIGDAVNLASRLEAQAEPGGVVIGEATRDALGDLAQVADLGELPVRGKEAPVRAFALLGLAMAPEGEQREHGLDGE